MRRVVVIVMLVVAALAVMAEDVTFLNNRRQWEQLPTATLNRMGFNFYEVKSMPDSALLCYTILSNRLQTRQLQGKELEQCIGAVCNLGSIYLNAYYDFSKAYSFLLQAEEQAVKHHQDKMLAYVYITLANLYERESRLNAAKPHEDLVMQTYKKVFDICIRQKEWRPIVPSFISMVEMAFAKEQLDSVTEQINTFTQLSIPDSVYGIKYAEKLCQGIRLWQANKREEAIRCFKELNTTLETLPKKSGFNLTSIVIQHITLSIAYLQSGQNVLALNEIKESERKAREFQLPDGLLAAYQNYIKYYVELEGNEVRADFYRLKRYELQDSLIRTSHVNDINTVRFLHEIDKMNEEQQALALKQRHDRQMLWVVSIAALIAIVMLVLLYLSRKRIQQGYRTIYQQNVELLAAEDARQRAAMAEQLKETTVETPKYSHNQMDLDVMDELWQQIVHLMQTSDEIYQDTFSIERLCDMLGAKRAYVSQTINTKAGGTFTTLLNEYRIREACRRMNDTENFGQYTIEGIANSVGYSRSYFVRIFKESTGIPPSAYMKLAKAGNADLPNADPHDSHPAIN